MDVKGTRAARPAYEKGQRLCCERCGAEIEVISPCRCDPPGPVLRCCGRDMVPTVGREVNLGVE